MKAADRQAWILRHLQKMQGAAGYHSRYCVDVLNRDFVDAYVSATNAKAVAVPYGADKCPQLGRDMSAMHAAGKLKRHTTGIEGLAGMGFPRWVWSYYL